MAIGTFSHEWKILSLDIYPTISLPEYENPENINIFHDYICGIDASLITRNLHIDHVGIDSHYIQSQSSWKWRHNPDEYANPVGFVSYSNLTEEQIIEFLNIHRPLSSIEEKGEIEFSIKFDNPLPETVYDPFGHGFYNVGVAIT